MVGALGYFISLVDAIPDITPVVGYTDDLWVLAVATVVVASHIKQEHREKAKETLNRWFGEDSGGSVSGSGVGGGAPPASGPGV